MSWNLSWVDASWIACGAFVGNMAWAGLAAWWRKGNKTVEEIVTLDEQMHVIKPEAYTVLYGAPDPFVDQQGWKDWVADKNERGMMKPTPIEWHEDNCPGCTGG